MRLVLPAKVHKWVRGQMVVLDESSMAATVVRLLEHIMGNAGVKTTQDVVSRPKVAQPDTPAPARVVGRKMVTQEPPKEVPPFNPVPRTAAEVTIPQRDGWAPRDFSKVTQSGRKEKK